MARGVDSAKKEPVNVRIDEEMLQFIDEHPLRKAEGQSGVIRHLLRVGRDTEQKEAAR